MNLQTTMSAGPLEGTSLAFVIVQGEQLPCQGLSRRAQKEHVGILCVNTRGHTPSTLWAMLARPAATRRSCVCQAQLLAALCLKQKQVENTSLPKLLCCSREAAIEIQETKLRDAECRKANGLQ